MDCVSPGIVQGSWFVFTSSVFDMWNVALLFDKQMHFPTVISFIETQMLGTCWFLDQDRANQSFDVPFFIMISSKKLIRMWILPPSLADCHVQRMWRVRP